jgi:transglutaminase-like putative cysteine protease
MAIYLDEHSIDWETLRCATIEVSQTLRYEYPGPIEDVHQVLVLVPPDELDGQRLLSYELQVRPAAKPRYAADAFGNRICQIALPSVAGALEFEVTLRVQRHPATGAISAGERAAGVFLLSSPLTESSPAIEAAAAHLRSEVVERSALVDAVNAWVNSKLVYTPGLTGIQTTAADALTLGAGVCQDYAHVMLALCRRLGLPARYLSGHLLGEGAMHAWVEVLLPAGESGNDFLRWQAFDPTHGCRTDLRYVSVAAGRDYGDVSPTRGSFRAPYAGYLAASTKRAGVIALC